MRAQVRPKGRSDLGELPGAALTPPLLGPATSSQGSSAGSGLGAPLSEASLHTVWGGPRAEDQAGLRGGGGFQLTGLMGDVIVTIICNSLLNPRQERVCAACPPQAGVK